MIDLNDIAIALLRLEKISIKQYDRFEEAGISFSCPDGIIGNYVHLHLAMDILGYPPQINLQDGGAENCRDWKYDEFDKVLAGGQTEEEFAEMLRMELAK